MGVTIELNSSTGRREVSLKAVFLAERKVFITGSIDTAAADDIVMQLMWLQQESDDPISIVINSPGGEVTSGLAVYDTIQSITVPIYMYCVGIAASMASLLLAGGQHGRRYILPHSKVMIHEPYLSGGVGGSAGRIQSTAQELLKTQQTFHALMARHTGRIEAEIEKAADHDNFMTAEEAVAFGICDRIVPGPLWVPGADESGAAV